MATMKDMTKAIIELKNQLKVLKDENAALANEVARTHDQAYAFCKDVVEEFIGLRNSTNEMLEAQRAEIEALKAERVIVREDGTMDTEAMALQALDLMTAKFEHIQTEIRSLDQTVVSLNHFRDRHLLDHEAEESKRREFTSYFDKHPGDRANI
jgi:uncharacterized protein with gpF-like domain